MIQLFKIYNTFPFQMRNPFQCYMFYILLLVLTIILLSNEYISLGTWNLNRTIGWGWDITNFLWWYSPLINIILLVIYTTGYGFLCWRNRPTKTILSIFHLTLTLPLAFNLKTEINFALIILSFTIFIFNFCLSFQSFAKRDKIN